MGDNESALSALERVEALPIFVDELQMVPGADATTVSGTVIGKTAAQGSPVQIAFTFYDDNGQLGTETVTVNAPAAEQSTEFRVQFGQAANAYSYELAQ